MRFERIGGEESISVDVRNIASQRTKILQKEIEGVQSERSVFQAECPYPSLFRPSVNAAGTLRYSSGTS
jgi:hypothetical protein